MTQIWNLHGYRNPSHHGSFHNYDQKTTVEFIYEWSKKTPIILTARISPFPDYKISTDYRNPSYHGSLHNYDQKIKIKKLHHIDHRTESDESNESYIIHNERGTGNATMKGK